MLISAFLSLCSKAWVSQYDQHSLRNTFKNPESSTCYFKTGRDSLPMFVLKDLGGGGGGDISLRQTGRVNLRQYRETAFIEKAKKHSPGILSLMGTEYR